jgi:hypothetical protein
MRFLWGNKSVEWKLFGFSGVLFPAKFIVFTAAKRLIKINDTYDLFGYERPRTKNSTLQN